MEIFWILIYLIVAGCNGAIPGTEVSTITLTSISITGKTTVTTTIPETLESPASLTATTETTDITTKIASSPSTVLVTRATLTTVFSEVLITPTTNSLGQSIFLTETITTNSFPEPSPTTPPPTTTIVSSQLWLTTTDAQGGTSVTWSWSVTTLSFPGTSHSTSSTSNLITQTSGSSVSFTASTTAIATSTSTPQKGLTKAQLAPILTVVGIVLLVFLTWLFRRCAKQDQHPSQPNGNNSWWRHPFNHFASIFPFTKQEPYHATGNDQAISRPTISSPIPFSERSTSPPNRPRRPISLSDSLMEDMRTSPQPRTNTKISEDSGGGVHRSFSPEPLVVVKNPQTSGPFGPDLEQNTRNLNPYSTTSWSSSVYSTATAGPSLPRPSYQPYRQPEIRHQERQYSNGEENDPETCRLQREETLRKLEDGEESSGLATTSEGEEDEVKSQGSYDFAEARARKVLEDKRMREQVWGTSRTNSPGGLPAIPELPGSPKRWV